MNIATTNVQHAEPLNLHVSFSDPLPIATDAGASAPHRDETTPNAFARFGLAVPLQRALDATGYTEPTPIQAQSIPALMAGRDMLGIAQTGTGKTAAFALPILHKLAGSPAKPTPKSTRTLILAPTRELVIQITDSIRAYGANIRMKSCAVFGGVSEMPQIKAMAGGTDILIATPGRLMDLAQRGHIRLDQVQTFVLDEADRMLDMGFIRDVNKIAAMLPADRQSLLFSATMPDEIARLAAKLLRDPVRVEVTPEVVTVERIAQKVYFVSGSQKRPFLAGLLADPAMTRVVVFTRTKHVANRVADFLCKTGIAADAIHGNKSQNARQRALESFKAGDVRVLVATDIAARGIHVSDVSHVVNYELPNIPESYVHRIGRTARAGAAGAAISLCDGAERAFLKDIERFIKKSIPVATADFALPEIPADAQGRGERPRHERQGGPRRDAHRKDAQRHGGEGRRGRSGSRDEGRTREDRGPQRDRQDGELQGRGERSRDQHARDRHHGGRGEAGRQEDGRQRHGKAERGQGGQRGEQRHGRRDEHRVERQPEHRAEPSHGGRHERHEGRADVPMGPTAEQPLTRAQQDRAHAERHFGSGRHGTTTGHVTHVGRGDKTDGERGHGPRQRSGGDHEAHKHKQHKHGGASRGGRGGKTHARGGRPSHGG